MSFLRQQPRNLLAICNDPGVLLVLIATSVVFWKLGQGSLKDWDEAVYAEISKEIIQSGHWLTLQRDYVPWFDKPPLFMWATAILYKFFGIDEFWSRAASAISSIGVIFVTYQIGKVVYGRWVGIVSGTILLTAAGFLAPARLGMTDIMLTFFVFTTIYGYLRLATDLRWWIVIWVSSGLALMTKGTAGLMAPAVVCVALFFDKRSLALIHSSYFWKGLLYAVVIVAPWHIWMSFQHGHLFWDSYLGHHVIDFVLTTPEGNKGDSFYYLSVVRDHFFPWSYLVPFALVLSIGEKINDRLRSCILLLFILLVFGVYSCVQTKIYWYMIPLYPALAILIASMIVGAIKSYKSLAFSALLIATLAVAWEAVGWVAFGKLAVGFACLVLFSAALLSVMMRRIVHQPVVVMIGAFLVIVSYHVILGYNEVQPIYGKVETPIAKLSRIAASTSSSDQEPLIVFSGIYEPAALFYSNRPILSAESQEDLKSFTKDRRKKRIILAKQDMDGLLNMYEIHVQAEAGAKPFVYATIQFKGGEKG